MNDINPFGSDYPQSGLGYQPLGSQDYQQSGSNYQPLGSQNYPQGGSGYQPLGSQDYQQSGSNYQSLGSQNYPQSGTLYSPSAPSSYQTPTGVAVVPKKKLKVSFNSPVVLSFVIICFVVLMLEYIFGDALVDALFSVYRSSLLSPLTYFRFFGHVLGHADMEHLLGNMMTLLIVGPLLEEKYGSKNMILVIVFTAFITGVLNFVMFPNVQLLGASGVVFALILLSSFTSMKEGEIPLTFILVAVLYLGDQIVAGLLVSDNISNFAHILGGICGSIFGYVLNKKKLANTPASSDNNVTYY